MQRVLLLTHWAPNILLFRSELLRQLVEQGAQVVVAAPDIPEFPIEKLQQMGVEAAPLKAKRNALLPWERWRFQREIRRVVEEWKPTAVATFSHYPNISFARAMRHYNGKLPFVWVALTTGMGRLLLPRRDLMELVRLVLAAGLVREYRRVAQLASRVVALNPDDLQTIQGWHPLLQTKAVHLPLGEGVNLERFAHHPEKRSRWRQEHQIAEESLLCGYVGRLMPEKGAVTFLKLALRCRNPHRYWVMVGRSDLGGMYPLLDMQIRKFHNSPRCFHLEWLEDPSDLYCALDLLISPSVGEGLPIAPLEALAAGTPVLLHDAPGSRELAGEGCRLVPTLRYSDWYRGVDEMLQLERNELRAGARRNAERFDHRLAMGAIRQLLEEEG